MRRRGCPPQAALDGLDLALSAGLMRVAISAGAAPASAAVAALAAQLASAIGSGKRDVLAGAVDAIVSRILGLGDLALERGRPLTELGLDSLMAVELRNALGAAIGRTLPTSLVFDHPTVEALCVFLAAELGLGGPAVTTEARVVLPNIPHGFRDDDPMDGARLDVVLEPDDLDDDAALLLLERKLSHAGY